MLGIISSRSTRRSALVSEQPRKPAEDNLAWLGRVLDAAAPKAARVPRGKRLASKAAPEEASRQSIELLLLGGTAPTDFRLRIAQAHARHDLSPSHWSHVALLDARAPELGDTGLFEVSLAPSGGFGFPPPDNGVQRGELARYADADAYPNIALLSLPVDADRVARALDDFRRQRAALDVPALILAWLAFTWGVGSTGNPLLAGQGIPSAAVLERVIGAAQFELAPGVVERASCPESIWQAALWWQGYYTDLGHPAPRGKYWAPHRLDGR